MGIVIRVDIVVSVALYVRMSWSVFMIVFSYHKESTPRWMGVVAWNVWTRASARRVASSAVGQSRVD